MPQYKECPYCGEEILAKAIKCKHCLSMLDDVKPAATQLQSDSQETKVPVSPPAQLPQSPPEPPLPAAPPPVPQSNTVPQPSPSLPSSSESPPPPPQAISADNKPAMPVPPLPHTNSSQSLPSQPPVTVGAAYPQQGPAPTMGAAASQRAYDYPKAELGKRILAYLIDGLVTSLPLMVTAPISFIPLYRYYSSGGWITPSGFQWVLIVLGMLAGLTWAGIYSLLRDGFGKGQSYGKKAAGLMVVSLEDNIPCTKKGSFIRNVVAIAVAIVLGWIPVVNFVAGFAEPIIAIIDKNGMRLGDHLAKTQVITVASYQRR